MGMDIHCFLEEYDTLKQCWDVPKQYLYTSSFGENVHDIWDDRSYWTFAWLGCNYRSKAIQPITEPRGLPFDISDKLKQLQSYSIEDGHNCSWFTLDELLEYFEVPVYCEKEFSQEYLNYLKRENKEVWQDPIWYKQYGGNIETKWTMPVSEVVNEDFINIIKESVKNKNPKHLRIVFWFDN
jgi:hypothetical protein